MYFVVVDNKGNAHLIEDETWQLAINKVPGGESVRVANSKEIERAELKK